MATTANSNKPKTLIGQKFHRLTVESLDHQAKSHLYYKCVCDCGRSCVIRKDAFITGSTKSCGCLALEIKSQNGKASRIPLVFKDDPKTGCRNCVSHKPNREGYITFWDDVTGQLPLHAKFYHEAKGTTYVPGRCVHHLCESTTCCNPLHLLDMSRAEHGVIHHTTGAKSSRAYKVLQFHPETGFYFIWPSAAVAEKDGGFSASNISQCCTGKKKLYLDCEWSRLKDVNLMDESIFIG